MNGPVINIPAYDPKVAGIRTRTSLNGSLEDVACHAYLEPIQVEIFGPNEVKISINGVARIVDAFALTQAINDLLLRYRRVVAQPPPDQPES
jgi:hypothetical protein